MQRKMTMASSSRDLMDCEHLIVLFSLMILVCEGLQVVVVVMIVALELIFSLLVLVT
jgi:hypothetical protein